MKRTPMSRGSGGLSRSTPMKRSELMTRSGRLEPRSKKQEAKYAGANGRRALVRRMLEVDAEGWPTAACRARVPGRCAGVAEHVHEILARSAGGSIVDESNCMPVCARCHAWIGDHPLEAITLGLHLSRYIGRNPTSSTSTVKS